MIVSLAHGRINGSRNWRDLEPEFLRSAALTSSLSGRLMSRYSASHGFGSSGLNGAFS